MPRTRPPYPAGFRAGAVRLARNGAQSRPALAADLGVSTAARRSWLRRADAGAGAGPPGAPTTDERAEPRRRRREKQVLEQAREIVAPAAARFAKETS